MKQPLIWFFETTNGTLVSDFAHSALFAKMKLIHILKCQHSHELKLVPTPLETGRTAHYLEMVKRKHEGRL